MKKKLAIALVLVVVITLVFSSVALADDWDYEDPCVADNEDFIGGWGFPGCWPGHYKSGAQEPWYPGRPDNEGYNLYRDNVTGTGNLDIVAILTFTPGKIALPIQAGPGPEGGYHDFPAGVYWKMVAASPDTWYWATEPRGYNEPEPKPSPIIASYIQIWLPDGKFSIRFNGSRRAPIDVNDGTWRFQLAPNVIVWNGKFGGAAERIIIGEDGQVANDVWFQRGEPIITRWEP